MTRPATKIREAHITFLGDLRCPCCRSIILTPIAESGQLKWVTPGVVDCPVCSERFEVTVAVARKANRRLDACGSSGIQEVMQQLMNEDD
jgi:hypothetical protein